MSLSQLSQVATILLALIFGTYAVQVAQGVLLPLVLALLIYALALPVIDFLVRRWKFARWAALISTGLVYSSLMVLAGLFTFVSIRNFSREANLYRARIEETVRLVQDLLARWNFEIHLEDIFKQIDSARILDWGHLLTSNILDLVSYVALVSIYVVFLFLGKSRSEKWPPVVVEIQKGISRYIWVKSLLSFLTAAIVGLTLWILGVEMTLLFTLLTYALNYIPSLGSILAVLLPLPVIWLQFGFGVEFWVFVGVAGLAQFYIGNIMEPKMLGRSLNLHPVTVMFFLVFWGFVWGIPGAFLSVPLTVVLKLFLDKIPATKSLSALLEGRLEF